MSYKTDEPTLEWLQGPVAAGKVLFHDGQIDRAEMFRLEVDLYVGRNSGPIEYRKNTDYLELVEEGILK